MQNVFYRSKKQAMDAQTVGGATKESRAEQDMIGQNETDRQTETETGNEREKRTETQRVRSVDQETFIFNEF